MQIPKISIGERKNSFKEVEIGFTEEEALKEANRCLNCKNPLCVEGCPANVNIPLFIKAFKEGRLQDAAEIIREKNFFPSICGRICQHEKQCEGNCILAKTKEGAVNIGGIERFIGDQAKLSSPRKLNGKKVAIVGSGPSGLTAAAYLALEGVNVFVFETTNSFGGVIKYGVPEFRLPKETVSKDLIMLHELGIDFEPNSKISEDLIEEVSKNYDAIFVGTGVGATKKLSIPGSDLKGIISAMKFLVNLNQSGVPMVSPGENVVVIGAGYVGIDASRSAIRLGANVKCITAATREDAQKSVSPKDYLDAEEGVEFLFGYNVDKFESDEDNDKVKKIFYTNGEKGSVQVDKVIIAIGQEHDKSELKNPLRNPELGCIEVNKKYQTKIKNVFAAGDCVHGPKTVIEAIANGRDAAKEILHYFKKIDEEIELKSQKDLIEKEVSKNKL